MAMVPATATPRQFASNCGRFIAGGHKVMLRAKGKTSNSEAIMDRSLTEVHERMIGRYWPDLQK